MDAKKADGRSNGTKGSNEWRVKVGLAEMLKGGVIMDVTNAEQAKIAEKAGACAVMALERVPSDIRKEGGVARMASIKVIREIMATVTIPVMAKVRIGHFAEAEVLQALEVDFIDESEVLTPADAALVRRLGAEAVFVGSGIFKSSDPETRAKAVVKAATHFEDAKAVLEAHEELGEAMRGLDVRQMEEKDMLSTRGW